MQVKIIIGTVSLVSPEHESNVAVIDGNGWPALIGAVGGDSQRALTCKTIA